MLSLFKNKSKLKISPFLISTLFFSSSAFAQLDKATAATTEFQVWLYGFLGVAVLVYMIWQVMLAMMDKQPWADVVTAIAKVAAAGGSIAVATWAFTIFTA